MPSVNVHLAPEFVASERLDGIVAVVDVLRATTTMAHALAAGVSSIRPCATIEEARQIAAALPGRVLLAGERNGRPVRGFDLGNSPREFSRRRCRGATVVMTTTNGTRALLHAAHASHVYLVAFVNVSAVCERLRSFRCHPDILCAGDRGAVALEDVLLAGAIVERLGDARNEAARLALAAWRGRGDDLCALLRTTAGGVRLRRLGYDEDITASARIDALTVVPELCRDPQRVKFVR
jgi:2-phosphosulfolactate phosphatase